MTTGTRTVTLASVADATTPYDAGAAATAPVVVVVPVQANGTNDTGELDQNSTDNAVPVAPSIPYAAFTGASTRPGVMLAIGTAITTAAAVLLALV